MRLSWRRSIAAFGAASVAALIAIGTAAAASSDVLVYQPKTKTVPTSTLPRVNGRTFDHADCPGTEPHVTGGGVKLSGDNSNLDLAVTATLGGGGHWLAEAKNSSGSNAQMRVTAICTKSGAFTYPHHDSTVPPHQTVLADVHCPRGTKLTGGGVSTSSQSPKVVVSQSSPEGHTGWSGFVNNDTSSAKTMTVQAVCADSGKYRYVDSLATPIPTHGQASVVATCPSGSQVTGGGVATDTAGTGVEVKTTAPFDSGDPGSTPDDGWTGTANNDTGQAATIQTSAICKVFEIPFKGDFTICTQVCPATVSFSLTPNRKTVLHWTWKALPIQCAQGADVVSSAYKSPSQNVTVSNHHFHASGVPSPEGFKTTLDGTLTDHDTKASGTLTMHGPEPPHHTNCHGSGNWSATAQ
jgi:hypothetical protein